MSPRQNAEPAGTERVARVIAQGLDPRSALGPHTELVVAVLKRSGWRVWLDVDEPGRGDGSQLASRRPGPASLTILQYPIWYPRAEDLRNAEGARLFWYHGVTPPELWRAEERDLLERSVAGTDLCWHAHLAVADSPFGAQELVRNSGYPIERVEVIPPAVNRDRFDRPVSSRQLEELKTRWNLHGKKALLYVGRVAPNKRVDLLIQAVHLLADRFGDVHLLIVGDTESLPSYRQIATELREQALVLGLSDRVSLTGPVADIAPYYRLADVFVTASLHEGFGIPLVEAMASGVPVVASASGAMGWVLRNESGTAAGLTFEPGKADQLAEKIAQVLGDDVLRSILVDEGRVRASAFTPERFASGLTSVIDRATSLALHGPAPAATRPRNRLHDRADVSLRDYRVRSRVPFLGPAISWFRRNSTSHIKEAYVDRIVERQVVFNRKLLEEIDRLNAEVRRLESRLAEVEARQSNGD